MFRVISFVSDANRPVFVTEHADKSDAIKTLVASRFNCPSLNHVLMDPDNFIVPASEITGWVENIRIDAQRMTDACSSFLRSQENMPEVFETVEAIASGNAPVEEVTPGNPDTFLTGFGTRATAPNQPARIVRTTKTRIVLRVKGASYDRSFNRSNGREVGDTGMSGFRVDYAEVDRINREFPGISSI